MQLLNYTIIPEKSMYAFTARSQVSALGSVLFGIVSGKKQMLQAAKLPFPVSFFFVHANRHWSGEDDSMALRVPH
jgi:hypothetical protein